MTLTVYLPEQQLLQVSVASVVAEAENGSFGLLPRHVDVVAALVPGILTYTEPGGAEGLVAVDRGILVKCGPRVDVSVRRAVMGEDLGTLEATVRDEFETLDEQEAAMHDTLQKLEVDLMRRFTRLRSAENH
jgi:F-type H+-transporting ATPase subunit epsilon